MPDSANPQDFNRYSYVENNPLRFVDPDGRCTIEYDPFTGSFGGQVCFGDETGMGRTLTVDFKNGEAGACGTEVQCKAAQRQLVKTLGLLAIGSAIAPLVAEVAAPLVALAEAGSAVTQAACADGDCTNEAKAGLEALSRAAEFGIRPYNDLQKAISGTGMRAHHIVEQRFAQTLGVAPRDMLSVALAPDEHKVFTNAWRNTIGYINSNNPLNTLTATPQDIWLAAQRIYADFPDLLDAARRTIFGE